MIYYKQNRLTKQLFRRVDGVSEEFIPKTGNGDRQEPQLKRSTIRQIVKKYLKGMRSK